MTSQLIDWTQVSLNLFNQSSVRIIWNLLLAFIPLTLSFYLFRPSVNRNIAWWGIFLVFMAFLPNAPYILTDSIHIIELSQQNYPLWSVILVLIPQYILFIIAGFEGYVVALAKLDSYLLDLTTKKYVIVSNALIHVLCVIGIYIGRFERFNSWDFVTKPGTVLLKTMQDLLDGWKILTMAIAFLLIWAVSELIKLVNQKIRLLLLDTKRLS
jgi:uncharacterized membrane protein